MIARVHAIEARSRANGPGARVVVWLQGCSLGCVGCFNPGTHAAGGGEAMEVEELVARVEAAAGVDGVTVSGGEPMEQPEAALAVLRAARRKGWSTLMFSGFTIEEVRGRRLGEEVLAELDVLVDGRFVVGERLGEGLRGSANQRIWLLTGRHTREEIEATPVAEVRIAADGSVVLTGVAPVPIRRRV